MGVIVVAGVPGVGKTSVLDGVSRKTGIKVVIFGTVMYEIAKERGLVEHRDEIRKLPSDVQRQLQEEAAERIREMGDVIVDTHMLIRTPAGFLPGLPYSVLMKLSPSKIILIEADPREILRRRVKDDTRIRDMESEKEIADHQLMNRIAALIYGILSGAFVAIVMNKDGMLEKAVEEVVRIIKS